MARLNTRRVGTEMERLAAEFLEREGFEILEMNYRCRIGEIDIVAREGRYLVFTEVKYRTDGRKGDPLEAVDTRKQRTILKVAMYYMKAKGLMTDTPCRFDAVGISENGSIRLVRDAFSF